MCKTGFKKTKNDRPLYVCYLRITSAKEKLCLYVLVFRVQAKLFLYTSTYS